MADKQFEIGIETTANTSGAQRAEASLDDVADKARELDAALDQAGSGGLGSIAGLPAQAKKVAGEIKEVSNQTARLGKGGDAGRSVLEFSRAFEDAQYGVRGVLNNLPGLIAALGGGAGVAGVISVVAVAGSLLWEKFGSGAKSAKKDTEDLSDTFAKLLKVYKDIEDLGKDDREKAAEDVAGNLKKDLSGIDNSFKISLAAEDVATAKATAEAQINLARDKLALARTESALVTATGTEAVRLAQQRETIIKRIYEDEQAIAEIGRTAALNKAQAKADQTGGKAEALEAEQAKADFAAIGLRAEIEALRSAADADIVERTAINSKIQALQARMEYLKTDPNNSFSTADAINNQTEIRNLLEPAIKELISKRNGLESSATDQIAQADAKAPALADAEAKLASSISELSTAVTDMKQAARDFNTLQQSQDIQRSGEAGLKQIADDGASEAKVETDKSNVVNQLDTLVSGIGESGGKDLTPFITEMKSILQDKALSADELAKLPVLLSQYFGKIANLGQAQNEAVRSAMSRVDDLERAVSNLKTTATQRNP